jgi:hypothetical protein
LQWTINKHSIAFVDEMVPAALDDGHLTPERERVNEPAAAGPVSPPAPAPAPAANSDNELDALLREWPADSRPSASAPAVVPGAGAPGAAAADAAGAAADVKAVPPPVNPAEALHAVLNQLLNGPGGAAPVPGTGSGSLELTSMLRSRAKR